MGRYHYVFPRWSNLLLPTAIVVGAIMPLYVVYVVAYGVSPVTINVGHQPDQPVQFSHALHAGQLGMDCRYCHNTVEYAAHAAIPPTQTCMNCHKDIHPKSELVAPVVRSYQTGLPIQWERVHDLPGYAYFDHSAHVNRGVSCVSCHGRIDRMEVVYQAEPLSMGWCLECHRNPDPNLRDPALMTDLDWSFESDRSAQAQFDSAEAYHAFWRELHKINPSQDCSTCHR